MKIEFTLIPKKKGDWYLESSIAPTRNYTSRTKITNNMRNRVFEVKQFQGLKPIKVTWEAEDGQ